MYILHQNSFNRAGIPARPAAHGVTVCVKYSRPSGNQLHEMVSFWWNHRSVLLCFLCLLSSAGVYSLPRWRVQPDISSHIPTRSVLIGLKLAAVPRSVYISSFYGASRRCGGWKRRPSLHRHREGSGYLFPFGERPQCTQRVMSGSGFGGMEELLIRGRIC